jgi:hypothetical protein
MGLRAGMDDLEQRNISCPNRNLNPRIAQLQTKATQRLYLTISIIRHQQMKVSYRIKQRTSKVADFKWK